MNRLNAGAWPRWQVEKYPSMPLDRRASGAALGTFLAGCDWFVGRVGVLAE